MTADDPYRAEHDVPGVTEGATFVGGPLDGTWGWRSVGAVEAWAWPAHVPADLGARLRADGHYTLRRCDGEVVYVHSTLLRSWTCEEEAA